MFEYIQALHTFCSSMASLCSPPLSAWVFQMPLHTYSRRGAFFFCAIVSLLELLNNGKLEEWPVKSKKKL